MNMGILEMQEVHRAVNQAKRRLQIIEAVRKNDPDNVPENFTAIYLRDNFFHVVPDEFLPAAKQVLSGGFEHIYEERRLTGWIGYGGYFSTGLELIDQYRQWCDKYL